MGCAMWFLGALALVALVLLWPDTEALQERLAEQEQALQQLEQENRRLRGAQRVQRNGVSMTWVSGLAVAGTAAFIVLVGLAFVDGGARADRDRLRIQLADLEARFRTAAAARDDLNQKVADLRVEVAQASEVARDREQSFRAIEAECDRLERLVRRLQTDAAANSRVDPRSHAAGLALLGLQPPFTPDAARTAYRNVSKTIHPDVCKGPEATRLMRLATDCYERITKT